MTQHMEPPQPSAEPQITLRSPAELADALPYLMGFHPSDSIVMVALHGERGRFGGRLRLGIPTALKEWPAVSGQLAECLVTGSEKRGERPAGIVAFLCQEPAEGERGSEVVERLRPLAQLLRTACGRLDVPVLEALCISGGRFWSYCCPDARCCPPEGTPLVLPGTSVMAATAAYAGIRVRGSLREMEARFAPLGAPRARRQEEVLDAAAAELVPRILGGTDRETLCAETMGVVRRLLHRFGETPPAPGRYGADARDDELVADDEAAAVILGLQDRTARDRAAEWMEGPSAGPALRLWRALARRCVGAYADHAAAPLSLAGWVAWSAGDEPEARVALGLALRADPDYLFAKLLHQGANEGLDPELLRRCLREERASRRAGSEDGRERRGSVRPGPPATPPDADRYGPSGAPAAPLRPAEGAAEGGPSGGLPEAEPGKAADVPAEGGPHGGEGGSSGQQEAASRSPAGGPAGSRPSGARTGPPRRRATGAPRGRARRTTFSVRRLPRRPGRYGRSST